MKTAFECIPCFVRQATEAVEMATNDPALRESLLRRLLREISDTDWNVMPVTVSQRMQRLVRDETGRKDPYHLLKKKMNDTAMDLLPELMEAVAKQQNPHDALVRLAIAGNLLDAGSKSRLAPEELSGRLHSIWDAPMTGKSEDLFRAINSAGKILYLADNAGEIVFDRLLIEALPVGKITVAVRGMPVINDATMEDARFAGLTNIVDVISNGSDAPGTILEECSEDFRRKFKKADLVISKGQGNYETLSDVDKNVFFLLAVKCPMISADVGAPVGSLVAISGKDRMRKHR